MDRLLLFAGYPRSGHTLVGALLDAHPQIVVAHQAYAVDYLNRGVAKERVLQLLVDNATRFTKSGRDWMGYHYRIPGQYQGKFDDLRLIGDKSGGITTRKIFEQGDFSALENMVEKAGLKPVFVHVIRNPFDIITTMTKRSATRRGISSVSEGLLKLKISHFLKHAEGVKRLKEHGGFKVVDIYSEDLVYHTIKTLDGLCEALGVKSNANYLEACANLVWDKPKQSRNTIDLWTPELVAEVMDQLASYTWFDRYTYTT